MFQDMNFYSKGNLTNIAKAILKSLDILYDRVAVCSSVVWLLKQHVMFFSKQQTFLEQINLFLTIKKISCDSVV